MNPSPSIRPAPLALSLLLACAALTVAATPADTRAPAPALAAGVPAASSDAAVLATAPPLRRGYVDSRYGQLHYYTAAPERRMRRAPPLVLLHQTPYSALELAPLVREMARDRVVLAIDTPGYGGSDGPPADQVSIESYAAAIADGLEALGYGRRHPVDVFGYHTGAYIAAQLAVAQPALVRRVSLSGIFLMIAGDPISAAVAQGVHHDGSGEFFAWFCAELPKLEKYPLRRNVDDRTWGLLIAESLRPVAAREQGHDAALAFSRDVQRRMQAVRQPLQLIAMEDGLGRHTRESRAFVPTARFDDLPQVRSGAFHTHTLPIAAVLRDFLR